MQQPRQQYGLGSIVKKAVKGVSKGIKKFAKSDLGKIALIGATAFGIPGTQFGGLLGRASFGGAAPSIFGKSGGISALFSKGTTHPFSEAVKSMGKGLGRDKVALGIGAASTLAGILASDPDMTEDQAEELKQDPVALRNYLSLYYSNLNPGASKEEVESFVRTNMYADGGRVNYGMGSNPAIKAPRASNPAIKAPRASMTASTQLGSPQGGTSLYGDVLEYLKRQGKDAPQRILLEGIPGPAMPSGGGSFNQSGGAINTAMPAMPFVGGGSGTGILQTAPSAPTVPMPKPKSNVAPSTTTSKTSSGMYIDPTGTTMEEYFSKYTPYWQQRLYDELGGKEGEEYKAADKSYTQAKKDFDYSVYKAFGFDDYVPEDYVFGDIDTLTKNIASYNMRKGYKSGDVVDQASGIMGLPKRVNKAGVKELDLRKSGGFIPPVGVKEKADDIPAMLSNNEFVFTADAVRGMGDGNVNKGAQRMYDMMKKLEEGGRV